MSKRSRNAISASMFELLSKDNFQDITISEICDNCDVVRRTFYNNFTSKEDVIEYIVDQHVSEYIDFVRTQHMETARHMAQAYYKFWYEKKQIVSILQKNNLFYILQRDFLKYVPELAPIIAGEGMVELMDNTLLEYLFTFISSGLCYNLEKWAKNDFKETYTDIGEVFNIIAHGLVK